MLVRSQVQGIYDQVGISPKAVATAVLYAISQPDEVDVSDLIVRPSKET